MKITRVSLQPISKTPAVLTAVLLSGIFSTSLVAETFEKNLEASFPVISGGKLAKITGRVEARDSGGNISIEAADSVTARTSSGMIHIRQAAGKVEASDSGGDIRIESADRDIVAETSSAKITIAAANGQFLVATLAIALCGCAVITGGLKTVSTAMALLVEPTELVITTL